MLTAKVTQPWLLTAKVKRAWVVSPERTWAQILDGVWHNDTLRHDGHVIAGQVKGSTCQNNPAYCDYIQTNAVPVPYN